MWRFILEVIVFSLISMLCFSAFGQNWQDEEHVWDEEKQEWVVKNKAHGRVVNNGNEKIEGEKFVPPSEEWARFLPANVRRGKRPPTEWEISKAKHKLWVKEIMTARAMQEAEQRRQLLAYRRATGWYDARRNAGLRHGRQSYNLYMSTIYRGYYRNGY